MEAARIERSLTNLRSIDVHVRPGDASLEQKLRDVYERGADN
jgi:hypothetical protein